MAFNLFLILIFIRPLISSPAFSLLNIIHTSLLFVILAALFLQNGAPIKKIGKLKYPLGLFIISIIISVIFSMDKKTSLSELYKYALGIMLFIFALSLSEKNKGRLIRVIVFSGFIIGILAINQYLFGFSHLASYIKKQNITNTFVLDYISYRRAFFPFVTPNALAGYLAMIIPLIFVKITEKNDRKDNKDVWLILLVTSIALFLTKSLSAVFALTSGILIFLYLKRGASKKSLWAYWITLALLIILFLLRTACAKEQASPLFSISQRLIYWQDTWGVIKSSPLVGIGIGNLNIKLSQYAHNSYLQLWAETGILGLVSFGWLLITIFKSAINNIKNNPNQKKYALLITACIIFLIQNLFDFTFFLPEVSFIWWALLGLF